VHRYLHTTTTTAASPAGPVTPSPVGTPAAGTQAAA
jgi:hypothetical protein